jgi:hypothetical protein
MSLRKPILGDSAGRTGFGSVGTFHRSGEPFVPARKACWKLGRSAKFSLRWSESKPERQKLSLLSPKGRQPLWTGCAQGEG